MYGREPKSWLKHLDFLILDLLCLQISFFIAYYLRHGNWDPYYFDIYRIGMLMFSVSEVVVSFFLSSYRDILRRGYYVELVKVLQQELMAVLMVIVYLFALQESEEFSRLTLGLTALLNLVLTYVVHILYKKYLIKRQREFGKKCALLVVTTRANAETLVSNLMKEAFGQYHVVGIALLDGEQAEGAFCKVPVVACGEKEMIEYSCRNWVDEVFIDAVATADVADRMINDFMEMGVTAHLKIAEAQKTYGRVEAVEHMGDYTVLTSSINMVTTPQLFLKRVIDIMAGIVGCIITVILYIFVAPIMWVKSPGPVFFSQERIGRNGKRFKIYKFRSMYMDAEERKKELMNKNNIKDGMMFKMDNDPRIIGSEKGPGKGFGNFIRRTSIDEFPQFFNILKGDMSLIGTRPPTVDEWEKYELHHRVRMAIRPGLTGLWQVSGRSEITDFEEVVELDREYIENWNFGVDAKIFLKTIYVVLAGKGSK